MRLSTKGRYGVKAMYDIAAYSGEKRPVSIKSIAERQQIPEQYLEQLMTGLRRGGLVKSMRGARGGYTLSRDAAQITIGEIIRAVDEPVSPVECDEDSCPKYSDCVTKNLWQRVAGGISDVIDTETLQDLLDENKQSLSR
ncbi:MAG: RrF2 family transcriptional regulator [Christensenellales bacterium]